MSDEWWVMRKRKWRGSEEEEERKRGWGWRATDIRAAITRTQDDPHQHPTHQHHQCWRNARKKGVLWVPQEWTELFTTTYLLAMRCSCFELGSVGATLWQLYEQQVVTESRHSQETGENGLPPTTITPLVLHIHSFSTSLVLHTVGEFHTRHVHVALACVCNHTGETISSPT